MKRLALLVLSALLATASCSHELEGPGEPTVKDSDLTYCGADSQSFVITGEHLSPMVREGATDDAEIDMPEVCLTRVADADGNPVSGEPTICIPDEDVEWVSQNEIRFTTRSDLGLTSGTYDVTVTNPDGSKASGGTVTMKVLSDGLLVFWADPNVVYNGISTQITVYGVNLGIVSDVSLVDCDAAPDQETTLEFTADPNRNNRLQAIVPVDTAPGTCDVRVVSDNGCEATLIDGVTITNTLAPTLVTNIDPKFGWADAATPVTIEGTGFEPVPRAYLNPVNPSPDTVASALRSVALVDSGTLTGVVPQGLPVGKYDVIVVNPNGDVGLLEDAFDITPNAPPVVASVTPNYLRNDGVKTMTVEGENLDPAEVTALCRQPDGTEVTLTGNIVAGGSATSFDFTLDVSSLSDGTVCVITVTNNDGSYFEYSAIGIANPSLNLNDFSNGPDMNTARRAPAVAAARATRTARFLYAIGGDDGSAANAIASVEYAAIGVFGDVGDWNLMPSELNLPGGRTLSGITRVGRFLYLVGGNDGSGPTASVLRAMVLDPLQAPEITDVAARRGEDGEGIGSGVWYYRVSAVMDDGDPSNPGGETLPSDPLVVNLAQAQEGTLVLTLVWEPVPGAKGYRVYRSPTPDVALGDVQLLAEVDGGATTTYEDSSTDANSGPSPLPLGATGVWMSLADLATPREALGVAAARDPGDATLWHLYAIGGNSGGALDSYEHLGITMVSDGQQDTANWAAGASTLSAARSELTGYAVTHADAVQVPAGTTYVYAGGGAESSNVDLAQVTAGGALTFTLENTMTPLRSGYAGIAGGGSLFAFGGAQSGPSDSNAKSEIDPANVPNLVNWNNEGVRLSIPRYLAGGAVESAFIFIVGGASTGGAVASMERTVL